MSDDQDLERQPSADAATVARHLRFHSLPGRVAAADLVEAQETQPPRGAPEGAGDENEWPLRWAAGG